MISKVDLISIAEKFSCRTGEILQDYSNSFIGVHIRDLRFFFISWMTQKSTFKEDADDIISWRQQQHNINHLYHYKIHSDCL
jgi:hypothetical protein